MKIGVIGTGNMGENHIRTYLSLHNHCELVGIYDTDDLRRNEIAKKYHVKPFHSIDFLLQSVDAVSIAVPTEFHYDVGLLCIQHNVHMLMEKPITSTVEQAKDLLKKANKAGVKIQVGHIELFNPLIQFLSKVLENEKILGLDHQRMSPYDDRLKNVDVVKDLMIHDLYILNKLINDSILEIYALGKVINGTPKHAVAITKSKQGVTANLTASFKSRKKIRNIRILTEDAYIDADILNSTVKITRFIIEDTSRMLVPVTEVIEIDNSIQPLYVQLLDFINCIKFDKMPSVSGEDGIITLSLTNKISASISSS
ncbi:Gfo/Idh/MocA family protein [Oceanobacillus bengalensis]|uniref:Gfo/Idh/MocA family oxidoreductase n=1 Tax=Oceanobacillus bengalensis TaxID=1435466 RepID=A0A494Z506_9BACI|nr:Gfo/Idh/MocA family oxidoreductase [Oceanobacillus bengalensis]RKQ17555.1 gfo/Idh/MocA family oxidoreductase [Oceanobacillus bengalensis]